MLRSPKLATSPTSDNLTRQRWRTSLGPLARALYRLDKLTFKNGLIGRARDQIKRHDGIRRAYHDLDILAKHGRFRPDRVKLVCSEHSIFVDPREPRGRAILRNFGRGQPRIKEIWRRAIDQLDPELVVDVGANYGEMVFAPTYAPGTRVVAVEANRQLADYLERSRVEHTNADQIELIIALASDHSDDDATLYVDPTWSGRSSAAAAKASWVPQKVRAVTIDDLASGSPSTLVFKIDVEGFEAQVLGGMNRILSMVNQVVGILEFHNIALARAGIDADAFLTSLRERFAAVAEVKRDGATTHITKSHRAAHLQGDLVVASTPDLLALALSP